MAELNIAVVVEVVEVVKIVNFVVVVEIMKLMIIDHHPLNYFFLNLNGISLWDQFDHDHFELLKFLIKNLILNLMFKKIDGGSGCD